jgi:hypothetical protein
MSTEARQVPLIELLRAVPADARILVDDKDGKGTRNHPVGALCLQAAQVIESEGDALTQCIQERDSYHEWADKLAAAISAHFGVDIGEHSSANNPWREALEAFPAAAAPAGGAEPVAWMYTLWFGDEAVQQVAFCYRFDLAVASPFGREGIDFAAGGKVEEQPLYAAPIAQPSRPDDQPEYTDSEFGFLVDTLNGLTEQETAASASVAGLSGAQPERRLCPTENLWDANGQPKPDAWKRAAQPEAPAEPSRDEAIRVWHKYCSPFASRLGTIPASPVIDAMLEFATPAPAAQQPAELTELKGAAEQALETLRTYVQTYNDYWERGMDILEPEGDAAIARLAAAIKAQGGSR